MKAILWLYQSTREPAERQRYLDSLIDFVDFSRLIQWTAVHRGTGLGEPKFTVDGAPYSGPWGRPQHDGVAIRAIELIHLSFILLGEGKMDLVRETLYDARLPTHSLIKTDLEYLSHHWRETCFDVWEEVRGHHFFTRFLVRRALMKGAALATRLGDAGAASWYVEQANPLGDELRRHWDPQRGYLIAVRDREGGASGQRSGLDSSVILATLGGYSTEDELEDLYPVDHEQVLATALALEKTFESIYPINDPSRHIAGIAIGRYPEDRYDGYRTDSVGNPWPGITIGFALYHYKLARRYLLLKRIIFTPTNLPFFRALLGQGLRSVAGEELLLGDPRFAEVVEALRREGDAFMERVRHHANPDGSMSEQMNRVTGFQQGARDLSMNYAAFLIALEMRWRLQATPRAPET